MTTIRVALQDAARMLVTDSANLDVEILLAHILKKPRSFLYTWPEHELSAQDFQAFQVVVQSRQAGMPIAYILGYKEFWSLPLKVNNQVLIPRPETELLVELALEKLDAHASLQIADIGTGSGAIALALATERPHWFVHAVDLSPGALEIAKENAAQLKINNIEFHLGSFCEPLKQKMHAIISNPPYIAEHDPHLQQGDLRFEPPSALVAENRGLSALNTIGQQARSCLYPNGLLLLEHGYDQAVDVKKMLEQLGYQDVMTHYDLAHLARVTSARHP